MAQGNYSVGKFFWCTPAVLVAVIVYALAWSTAAGQDAPAVSVVDLTILYTSRAAAASGGTAAIRKQIDRAVLEANTVFQNSHANVRIRLRSAARVKYPESGDTSIDFDRLNNTKDGFLDFAPAYKAATHADLLCLVVEAADGYPFLALQGPSAFKATSIIRRDHLAGSYYFPVMLSFNFGCQVQRGQAGDSPAFPYGYGYTFSTTNGDFTTVERSYGQRIPYFSNPEISWYGVPIGVPEGQTNAADNAAVLNETAPLVSAYTTPALLTVPPTVTITSPTNWFHLHAGDTLALAADAHDSDGRINRVEYWLIDPTSYYWRTPTNRIASSADRRGARALWSKVPAGTFSLVAVAMDNLGAVTISDPIQFRAVPRNDDFADARRVSGTFVSAPNVITAATLEPGEPDISGHGWGTIWWTWTAPASGWAQASLSHPLYATLRVYEGTALTNLVAVREWPYTNYFWPSFACTAGTEYRIAGAGPPGEVVLNISLSTVRLLDPAEGSHFPFGAPIPIRINRTYNDGRVLHAEFYDYGRRLGVVAAPPWNFTWTNAPPGEHAVFGDMVMNDGRIVDTPTVADITVGPPNDDFASRQVMNGLDIRVSAPTDGATLEPGEPTYPPYYPSNSVWFSWTAPSSGVVTLMGSDLNYFSVDVFTGTQISDLALVTNGFNRAVFAAVSNTMYAIRITGGGYYPTLRLFLSTIQITNPRSGSEFPIGADVPIEVASTPNDGPFKLVQFFANSTSIGVSTNPPFSFVWSNAPAGEYFLTARATNSFEDVLVHSSLPVPVSIR